MICDPAPCVDLGPEAVGGSRSLGQLSIPHTAGGSSDGRKPTVTLLAAGRRRPPLALGIREGHAGRDPLGAWWRLLRQPMPGLEREGHRVFCSVAHLATRTDRWYSAEAPRSLGVTSAGSDNQTQGEKNSAPAKGGGLARRRRRLGTGTPHPHLSTIPKPPAAHCAGGLRYAH